MLVNRAVHAVDIVGVRKIWQVRHGERLYSHHMSNEHVSSLGAFSVSLRVKDIQKSKEFYGKLGFEQIGGDEAQG